MQLKGSVFAAAGGLCLQLRGDLCLQRQGVCVCSWKGSVFTAVGGQCLQLQESVFVAAGRSVFAAAYVYFAATEFAIATGEFWQ